MGVVEMAKPPILAVVLMLLLALVATAEADAGHHHDHHHDPEHGEIRQVEEKGGSGVRHLHHQEHEDHESEHGQAHGHEHGHEHGYDQGHEHDGPKHGHGRKQGHGHGHGHGHEHHHHPHTHSSSGKESHGHGHGHGEEAKLGHGEFHHGHDSEDEGPGRIPPGMVWAKAMGCSLLVSLCSLICLLLLPLIAAHGKPSASVVDALAGFGAGSMLGDALLHQLPHAFGGSGHAHHGHEEGHGGHEHGAHGGHEHEHAHSLADLSVGLAVLAEIMLFFLVEKIVRRTEELTVGKAGRSSLAHSHSHSHSHHLHRVKKDEDDPVAGVQHGAAQEDLLSEQKETNSEPREGLRRRGGKPTEDLFETDRSGGKVAANGGSKGAGEKGTAQEQDGSSRRVLGYLNLFSDGVHNFTDGMALGSAFLVHGTVGGWSRTLFLLAHELPQEVGDFGILLRSGFGVFQALAFNFLSALVALAGTALALLLGGNPGHSNLIEGFTAGGFMYIAIGAVMPDMHSQGSSLRTSVRQVAALGLGIGVAMAISLAE